MDYACVAIEDEGRSFSANGVGAVMVMGHDSMEGGSAGLGSESAEGG